MKTVHPHFTASFKAGANTQILVKRAEGEYACKGQDEGGAHQQFLLYLLAPAAAIDA